MKQLKYKDIIKTIDLTKQIENIMLTMVNTFTKMWKVNKHYDDLEINIKKLKVMFIRIDHNGDRYKTFIRLPNKGRVYEMEFCEKDLINYEDWIKNNHKKARSYYEQKGSC